jgi:tetratricopeptide (TPR) repeat protein
VDLKNFPKNLFSKNKPNSVTVLKEWIVKNTSLKFCSRLILFITATHGQVAFSETHSNWNDSLSAGISYKQLGKIQLSIDLLSQAKQSATTTSDRKRAAGELAASQLQARRLDQAETSLQEAYKFFAGVERARYAIDLGNLALIRKHPTEAQPYYVEALQLASHDVDIHILAGLNLARLIPDAERLPKLNELFQEISKVGDANLGLACISTWETRQDNLTLKR